METALSLFRADGYTVDTLDNIVTNVTYVPQTLGALGVFTPTPINTRGIEVNQNNVTLRLIPTTQFGSHDVEQIRDGGVINYLRVVRLAKKDRVIADELADQLSNWQNPTSPQARASADDFVTARLAKLRSEMEMTMEFHRLGALQGLLLDADQSTVIYNYWNQFNLVQPAIVNVDFNGTTQQALAQYFTDTFVRPMMRTLKNRKTPNTKIYALVGDTFWRYLLTHPAFYQIWALAQQGRMLAASMNPLLTGQAWNEVEFGGVTWVNYMGTDDGSTIAIPSRQAIFFPVGATDVFRQYMSYGESIADANTMGKPLYPYVVPDPSTMNEWVDIKLRSYPLFACIYPQVLMRAQVAASNP